MIGKRIRVEKRANKVRNCEDCKTELTTDRTEFLNLCNSCYNDLLSGDCDDDLEIDIV